MHLWYDEETIPLTEEFYNADKLETSDGEHSEFYIVGKDFAWTYIVTHEIGMGLGPYFMSIK